MKKIPRKILAAFMTLIMMFSILSYGGNGRAIAAETDSQFYQESYKIQGYNRYGNISGVVSGTVDCYGYCLDYKNTPPSAVMQRFVRIKLSELTSYEKKVNDAEYLKVYTEEAKIRLLKVLMAKAEISEYVNDNLFPEEEKQYIVDGVVANTLTVSSEICTSSLRAKFDNNEITESEFRAAIRANVDNCIRILKSSGNLTQYLIWCFVHESSEWSNWVSDNGTTSGHQDHYCYNEKRYYYSENPIRDQHSLWNQYYKKIADYIDSQLPDYFDQGYDAWVYLTTDTGIQNILGAPFKIADLKVVKRDFTTGQRLNGATLQLLDKNLNVLREWQTSYDGQSTDLGIFDNIITGDKYYIREIKSPFGYESLTEKIEFTVNLDGTITSSAKHDGNTLYVDNNLSSFDVIKVDEAGNKIKGASLCILNPDGKDFSWTSSAIEAKSITLGDLNVDDSNTTITLQLKEIKPASGYLGVDSTNRSFELAVDDNGIIKNVTLSGTAKICDDGSIHYIFDDGFEWYLSDANTIAIVNKKAEVSICKVDIANGEEISGAKLSVYDSSNTLVDEWISGQEAHKITNLTVGEKYTLSETVAPEGYLVTTDIEFSVDEKGNVISNARSSKNILYVEDAISKVAISKKDVANSSELKGAILKITGDADWNSIVSRISSSDKHNVIVIYENNRAIGIEWESTDEALELSGLLFNTEYVMEETGAPAGYLYSENIIFKLVDENGVVATYISDEDGNFVKSIDVTMYDERATGNLIVTKSIDGLNVTDEEKAGALTFTICDDQGNYLDENGNVSANEVSITLDKFTKKTSGIYVLELLGVPTATYTITETNSAIEGYTFVTTSVTSDVVTVENNKTSEASLKDIYEAETDTTETSDDTEDSNTSDITETSDDTENSITSDISETSVSNFDVAADEDVIPQTGDRGYLGWLITLIFAGLILVFGKNKKRI